MNMTPKTILITAGDPLGIGPEVTVKALKDPRVRRAGKAVVIGEPTSLKQAGFTEDLARLVALEIPGPLPAHAQPDASAGRVSFQAVKLGIKWALEKNLPLVTAPINKQSWAKADVPFTGHTEVLRTMTQANGLMMFISGNVRCALVTEHFAIADLPHILTKNLICTRAKTFYNALQQLGIKKPKIAVCALNPHAGDNGQFGSEEKTRILPALRALAKEKILLEGPFPCDSLWQAHALGKYDGILCMYHDQALLPLKLAAHEPIVHITAGLPFLRVSPTHGTAFDIAGKNQADPSSMISAILTAAHLIR